MDTSVAEIRPQEKSLDQNKEMIQLLKQIAKIWLLSFTKQSNKRIFLVYL